MKIAIVGSRTFDDYDAAEDFILSKISLKDIELVVSGGAKGADHVAELFAARFNIPLKVFLPDWNKYQKRAGIIRNFDIVGAADIVFAFWDGESKGTKHDIEICEKQAKTCYIFKFTPKPIPKPVERKGL